MCLCACMCVSVSESDGESEGWQGTGHALYLVIKRQHILSDVETGTFKKKC